MNSVFFATFSRYIGGVRYPTNGMVDPMLYFLPPKVRRLVMLDAPHLVSDTIDPIVEIYKHGKLAKRYVVSRYLYLPIYWWCVLPSKQETRISFKLRDFFSVFLVGLREKEAFDLFIGLEAIYAIAGIILKKLGKVRHVVYYVSDYSPIRFGNKVFNALYVWMDRFCVEHADVTWDVSPAMKKGRQEAGLSLAKQTRVIHVPNGLFPPQIRALPIAKRNRYDAVYMGILEEDMGPDLAIRAFVRVVKKYKKARLHIIGGPAHHIVLMKQLARDLGISEAVIFHGFIPSNERMAAVVRSCAIGLAPYRSFKNSKRWYGDAGKIRQYTAAGLPVVTTHVPPLGKHVVSRGAGIMVRDTPTQFAQGIMKLFASPVLYKKLTDGAIAVSRDNTWRNVYINAFQQTATLIGTKEVQL